MMYQKYEEKTSLTNILMNFYLDQQLLFLAFIFHLKIEWYDSNWRLKYIHLSISNKSKF